MYAGMLMTGAIPEKLDEMIESCCPSHKCNHVDFGEDILTLARSLYEDVGDDDAMKQYAQAHVGGLGPKDYAKAMEEGK